MRKLSEREVSLLKRTFLDYEQTLEFIERPLVVSRAEGLYYWDVEGRRYFDAIGGIFVAVLGHRHPRLVEAMRRQLDKMTFAPPLHGIADVTLEFVEKLGSVAPGSLKYVKPFSGGSESIEAAMKFTRQYFKQTGRGSKYKFISRYQGYHGSTFGAMAASGTGMRKSKFEPQMGGFLKVFPPTFYRDRFSSWDECNRFAARSVEDVILAEDPSTVAGVIVEPIGNTGGIITPTEEYFRILREVCTRLDVMLIFDEVITGFARTGRMFAAQTFGVTPDLLCAGKGLSSGMIPLGSMMARQDMGEAFLGPAADNVQFAHGNTFAGNPLACAVGIAVIDEIVGKRLDEKAQATGEYLVGKLEGLRRHGVIRDIRGKGMLRGVEFGRDDRPLPPGKKLGPVLKRKAMDHGLIMRIDPDWFAVAPAVIAEEKDIDELYELIDHSLKQAIEEVRP